MKTITMVGLNDGSSWLIAQSTSSAGIIFETSKSTVKFPEILNFTPASYYATRDLPKRKGLKAYSFQPK